MESTFYCQISYFCLVEELVPSESCKYIFKQTFISRDTALNPFMYNVKWPNELQKSYGVNMARF